jgi:tol-pal system protein YbgF
MMNRAAIVSVIAVLAALGAASPAHAQNKREMQMMADIRMLQEQNQQLQVSLAQLGEALNTTIRTLAARLDEQANANRKSFADTNLKVDQFGSDLRVVREGVSETNVRIASLSQEMEALRLSIPQSSQGMPAATMTPGDPNQPPPAANGAAPAPGTSPPAAAAPPPAAGIGMSPQRLYDTAWADYTAGQWELCISGFDTYLRTFPRTDLADEAQFYIGECNYADGKNQEAVQAYNQVITNYPRGQSVAPAYYKRGLAFERLGQVDRAKESFDAVIKSFPDSDAARLAKQNLDRINRGKPQR